MNEQEEFLYNRTINSHRMLRFVNARTWTILISATLILVLSTLISRDYKLLYVFQLTAFGRFNAAIFLNGVAWLIILLDSLFRLSRDYFSLMSRRDEKFDSDAFNEWVYFEDYRSAQRLLKRERVLAGAIELCVSAQMLALLSEILLSVRQVIQ